MIRLASVTAALLFLSGCASTTGNAPSTATTAEPAVRAEAPQIVETQEFLAFLDTLEQDIENGEPRQLTSLEVQRVNELSQDLRSMLENVESVEELNNNQQSEIYNKTQELWAAVVGRDEDQVICRREHRVGTNFKSTRCRSVREIREDQRSADRYLRTRGPGPMPQGG